jgi:two-component system alkaline phosphatase synthesis response regulator PhoP
MSQSKQTILCVDDNKDNLDLITFVFERTGFEVTACDSLEECLSHVRRKNFQAIILDNHFAERTSLEVCQEIRFLNKLIPILFYSGEARPVEIARALAAGGNAYLVKPNDFERLTETVIKLIRETPAGI